MFLAASDPGGLYFAISLPFERPRQWSEFGEVMIEQSG